MNILFNIGHPAQVHLFKNLIWKLEERGHEYKINPKTKELMMSIKEFETKRLKAKKILEKVTGEKVVGYRAPNAFIGGWMLDSLEKIGVRYDSSVCVNSLYNKTDSSLGEVSSYPYSPKTDDLKPGEDRDFVEYPWAFYDIGGFKVPTSGGPMLRFLGARMMLKGLKQSLKRGHTVFYFHPIDVSYEKFPEIGKGRPMYWAIKGKVVENRIRYILKTLKDVEKECLKSVLTYKTLNDI